MGGRDWWLRFSISDFVILKNYKQVEFDDENDPFVPLYKELRTRLSLLSSRGAVQTVSQFLKVLVSCDCVSREPSGRCNVPLLPASRAAVSGSLQSA